ncbi:MAG: hypothetical protein ACOYN4_00545 [Bacteroidales bacterium]
MKIIITTIFVSLVLFACNPTSPIENQKHDLKTDSINRHIADSTQAIKDSIFKAEAFKADSIAKAYSEKEDKLFMKSKAGKIYKTHPTWSKEDCKLLAENKIWIGMGYDMLVFRRGKPNSETPSNYGNGTQWQYCWYDYTPMCFYDDNDDGLIDKYN